MMMKILEIDLFEDRSFWFFCLDAKKMIGIKILFYLFLDFIDFFNISKDV